MKLTYVTHACILFEFRDKTKLLTDPWFYSPVYGSTLYQFPRPKIKLSQIVDVDFIYISHDHPDHFCSRSLSLFKKTTIIIIRDYGNNCLMTEVLISLGFTNIVKVPDEGKLSIGKEGKFVLFADKKSTDSLAIICDNCRSVLFQNDCMLPVDSYKKIAINYDIDVSLQHYSNSSVWPNCFDLSEPEIALERKKRDYDKFFRAIKLAITIKSKCIIPIASDMASLRNEIELQRRPPNALEFAEFMLQNFPNLQVKVMFSGDSYNCDSGLLEFGEDRQLFTTSNWDSELADYRNSASVRNSIEIIDNWERSFAFNPDELYCQLQKYIRYVNTRKLYIGNGQSFNASICPIGDVCFDSINISRNEFGWFLNKNTFEEFRIEIKDFLLGALLAGGYSFEDFLNQRYLIKRDSEFSEPESDFWQLLSGFSYWQRSNITSCIDRPGDFITIEQ